MHLEDSNPRRPDRRSSVELTRAVRAGRRVGESLRALDVRAARADDHDRLLAHELARFLVRRCEGHHEGWRVLRQALLDGGAELSWDRCERLAFPATAVRVMIDCAAPGRTPLRRVQHVAAQERARALTGHSDAASLLKRLGIPTSEGVTAAAWERALVSAVTARSRDQVVRLLAAGVAGVD